MDREKIVGVDSVKSNGWSDGIAEWVDGLTAYLSVVFSWNLPVAYSRAVWLHAQGYRVRAGGPAVALNPAYLADVAEIGGEVDALSRHNPNATITSRGCIRCCPFCAVPRVEGNLRELADWEPRPIVCDNNLLACSRVHFDRVIDRLKPLRGVDFNQGLDARLMTKYHAERLAELDLYCVRLAWDSVWMEGQFMTAFERLRSAGIPKRYIRVYVLIGFDDGPADALYRLETVRNLGILPNPMRYQPLNSLRRDKYVNANIGWSDVELRRYMRYWSRLIHFGPVPFKDFGHHAAA
jgi:hypothetical protein